MAATSVNVVPLASLDLFSNIVVQNSVITGRVRSFRPIAAVEQNTLIEFSCESSPDEYFKLSSARLCLRLQITLESNAGDAPATTIWNEVSPVNNILHSLFERIDVYLGDQIITSSATHYAYAAFFESLKTYSQDVKRSYLLSQGYEIVEPDKLNSALPTVGKLFTPTGGKFSKIVEFSGLILLPFFQQPLDLLGGCKLRVILHPSSKNFHLVCPSTYKASLDIKKAELQIYSQTLNPQIVVAHQKALTISNARYPLTRLEVISTTIAAGSLNADFDNLIRGLIPRRLYVTFVANDAFNGTLTTTPFRFEHFGVKSLALYVNGELIGQQPLQPDFDKGIYLNEYTNLFQSFSPKGTESNAVISRKWFQDGYTFFAFNLSEDLSNGLDIDGYTSLSKFGHVRLELQFARALPKVVNVLVFCEFDSVLEIDQYRKATVDF